MNEHIVNVIDRSTSLPLWTFSFDDLDEAESMFVDLICHYEGEEQASDEYNGALDDGYWETETVNITIGGPVRREDFPFNKV
jgi:hypothetical protein